MIRSAAASAVNPRPRTRRGGQSKFKKVDIRRAVSAAQSLGLSIGGVEIKPDGTISIATVEALRTDQRDLFTDWSDRL